MTRCPDIIDLVRILDVAAIDAVSALGNGILASPDDLAFLLRPEFVLERALESDNASSAVAVISIENGIVNLDAFEVFLDLTKVKVIES